MYKIQRKQINTTKNKLNVDDEDETDGVSLMCVECEKSFDPESPRAMEWHVAYCMGWYGEFECNNRIGLICTSHADNDDYMLQTCKDCSADWTDFMRKQGHLRNSTPESDVHGDVSCQEYCNDCEEEWESCVCVVNHQN